MINYPEITYIFSCKLFAERKIKAKASIFPLSEEKYPTLSSKANKFSKKNLVKAKNCLLVPKVCVFAASGGKGCVPKNVGSHVTLCFINI